MRQALRRACAMLLVTALCLGGTAWHTVHKQVLRLGFLSDSYWGAPQGNCYAVVDTAIARFEAEHPNVRVEYTSGILKQDYSEWLIDQCITGREPDVFMVLPEDFGTLYGLGALERLDGRIEGDPALSQEDFYRAAMDSGRIDGGQYAMPYECVPTLMFVNRTLLNQNNVALPSGDWTWEDFYDICAKLTRDTNQDGVADQFGSYGYTLENAIESNGAALFSNDGTQCLVSQPEAETAIAFTQKLERLNSGASVTSRDFDQGRVAFRPFLLSDYRTYQPYPWRIKRYSDFNWDCISMPRGPSGANSSSLSTVLVSMSSQTAHRALAWDFIKELTGRDETQQMIYTDSHGASALKRVTTSHQTRNILSQDAPGDSQLALDMLSGTMENATAVARFPKYDQAMLLAQSLIGAAIQQETGLPMRLQQIERELDKFLTG